MEQNQNNEIRAAWGNDNEIQNNAARRNERRRERRWEKDQELKESNPELWQQKRDARNERKRANKLKLKEENPELWQQKRDARNEERRERRRILKEGNPTEYQKECETRNKQCQQKRAIIIKETPEEHASFLAQRRKKELDSKVQTWNDLFDSLYEENKHTFPSPVSQKLWETLKQSEIDFLLSNDFKEGEIDTNFLISHRQEQLEFLRKFPKHPHGGSIIFYIKTMVHRPRDQRIINSEELNYINCLILPGKNIDDEKILKRRQYYEKKREKEIELAKSFYQKKKSQQILDNLNLKFIKADPNKVLSLDDICHNPFITNFSYREEFKVNLYKSLGEEEKPEFLEKWKKQRENYEKEVEDLAVEYKTEFLARMGGRNYYDE